MSEIMQCWSGKRNDGWVVDREIAMHNTAGKSDKVYVIQYLFRTLQSGAVEEVGATGYGPRKGGWLASAKSTGGWFDNPNWRADLQKLEREKLKKGYVEVMRNSFGGGATGARKFSEAKKEAQKWKGALDEVPCIEGVW